MEKENENLLDRILGNPWFTLGFLIVVMIALANWLSTYQPHA